MQSLLSKLLVRNTVLIVGLLSPLHVEMGDFYSLLLLSAHETMRMLGLAHVLTFGAGPASHDFRFGDARFGRQHN